MARFGITRVFDAESGLRSGLSRADAGIRRWDHPDNAPKQGDIRAMLDDIGPMLDDIGPMLGSIGAMLGSIGVKLGSIGPKLDDIGPMLGSIAPRVADIAPRMADPAPRMGTIGTPRASPLPPQYSPPWEVIPPATGPFRDASPLRPRHRG